MSKSPCIPWLKGSKEYIKLAYNNYFVNPSTIRRIGGSARDDK